MRRLRDGARDIERRVDRHLDADMAAERLQISVGEGIVARAHDLQPPGAVGVDDSRNLFARAGLRPRREHHVVIGIVIGIRSARQQIKILLCGFKRRHRRQRPDRFAIFHPLVEPFARLGVAGIGEDRAVAERAGPGFGGALIDRDDAVLRDRVSHQVGDGVAALRCRDLADALRSDIVGLQRGGDVIGRGRYAAIERVRHRRAAWGARKACELPGSPDGDAGIAGHRRHPQMQAGLAPLVFLEPRLVEMFEQPHIADRVQRDATGQHQAMCAGRAQQMIHDMDHRILEHQLRRGRLVEPVLCVGPVLDVLDAQHRVGIPQLLRL